MRMSREEKPEKKKITLKDIGMDKLLLILMAGVVLVIFSFPGTNKDTSDEQQQTYATVNSSVTDDTYEALMEKRLENVLSKVDGVGKVQVMITLKSSSEKVVKSDQPYTKSTTVETDSEGGSRSVTEISQSDTTVYMEDDEGNSVPYVVKELEPEIQGVAIIAQGGDDPVIVSNITNAVEALFQVSAHKIKVMKMVDND